MPCVFTLLSLHALSVLIVPLGPFFLSFNFPVLLLWCQFCDAKNYSNIQEMAGTFSKRLWIKCYLPLRRGRRFIHINLLQLRVRVAVLFNWFLDTRMKLANLTFFPPKYCEQLDASQEAVRTIWSQTCHERQRNRERGTLYPLDCFLLGTPYPLDHFLIRRILQLHCTDADLITSSSKALNRQANTARARWKDSNNETARIQRNFLSS